MSSILEPTEQKPSRKEKIKELEVRIVELNALLAEAEKKVKSAEDMKKYYNGLHDEATKELNGMHDLLDTLSGALPREKKESWQGNHTLAIRFASWLASKLDTKA